MTDVSKPVRVMVVEDSLVVRQLVSHIIRSDPRFVLVAAAASAEEALAVLDAARPDVISMDIRLPGMDGLEATRRIMSERPTPIVVFADAVEEEGLHISLNALRAGALAVVEKPVGPAAAHHRALAETLCTQLFIMSSVPVIRRRAIGQSAPAEQRPHDAARTAAAEPRLPAGTPVRAIGLGASTGGPAAFARVLAGLSPDIGAAVFVVQHMGPAFMAGFADWLNGLTALPVALAQEGEVARRGRVYVAPGDRHLRITPGGVIRLGDDAPAHGQRPSASVLFASLADAYGPAAAGVLMTGMGEDGAAGLAQMRRAGSWTAAEDRSSAVVYGMPGAAMRLGAARESLSLADIAPRLALLAGARP